MSSLIFAIALGIPLGIIAGVKYRSLFDRVVWLISLFMSSLPPFWTGLIFLTIFYFNLGIAPGPGGLIHA